MLKHFIGFTILCLIIACSRGNKGVIIQDGKKNQLHRLAEFGRLDKILEEYNPRDPIDPGNPQGYTPLMLAATASFASQNHVETFNYLIKKGAQTNPISSVNSYNTFHLAARNPHVLNKYNYIMLNKLLKTGVDINKKNKLGQTPLLLALESFNEAQHSPIFINKWFIFYDWLIKNKADTHSRDNNGNTVMSIAKRYNNKKLTDKIKSTK